MAFTFADMCCGIGGFHVAMAGRGGQCVFACDIDPSCRDVYFQNFGIRPEGDLVGIDPNGIPDHDVLCAGFPCQSFSNAGKKRGREDDRGLLFDVLMRIVDIKRPSRVLFENVRHIRTIDGGKMFSHILESFDRLGYDVRTVDLSPLDLGVPQKRPRVFFCGLRRHDPIEIPFHSDSCLGSDFSLAPDAPETYVVPRDIQAAFDAWNEALPMLQGHQGPVYLDFFCQSTMDPSWAKWKADLARRNNELYQRDAEAWDAWLARHAKVLGQRKTFRKLEWQAGCISSQSSIWDQVVQLRPSGIRVKTTRYYPTLVAMVQVPIVGPLRRYLTPRECARLQSFPDDFKMHPSDHVAYKHLGNSVNVRCVLRAFDIFSQMI
jgi:DNA (cytosine-5)-methyltransferase 1